MVKLVSVKLLERAKPIIKGYKLKEVCQLIDWLSRV